MATLHNGIDLESLDNLIVTLRALRIEAEVAETSEEAFRIGAKVSALHDTLDDVACDIEEAGTDAEAEEEEEEWEPDYDDDFPMYLEYDDWKEDNHPLNDIDL